MASRSFQELLFSLSKKLTNEDLSDMKFLCANEIPSGRSENIKNPRDFFQVLQQDGIVSEQDCTYLEKLLENTKRLKLLEELKSFQATQRQHKRTATGVGQCKNLPSKIRTFVGRDDVLQTIKGILTNQEVGMCVIVAPPGYGKSALASQVGHALYEERDISLLYVSLRKITTVESLGTEILNCLGISLGSNRLYQAQKALGALEKETVLILDNAEDLLQEDHKQMKEDFLQFVEYLGRHATSLRLLVTSRKDFPILSFDVEKIKLQPLDRSSSAKILKYRASLSDKIAEKLGHACGGIPLLLRIVASRIQDSYNPKAMLAALKDNPIAVLQEGDEDLTAYRSALLQFLRKCLGKDLLAALIGVSVFPTCFTAEDATILFNNERECRSMLARLVGNALLCVIDASYSIHPFIQSLCRTETVKLNSADVAKRAEKKFNNFFLGLLKKTACEFMKKHCKSEAIDKFRAKEMKIVQAIRNSLQPEKEQPTKIKCLDICSEAANFLAKTMTSSDCHKLLTQCIKAASEMNDRKRYSDFLTSLGFRHMLDLVHLETNPRAVKTLETAYDIQIKELTKKERSCEKHAHCMSKLGLCYTIEGNTFGEDMVAKGESLINKAVELRRCLGNKVLLAAGYEEKANAYQHRGRYDEAIQLLQNDVFPVYEEQLGDHPFTASALGWLGFCFRQKAQYDLAEEYIKKAMDMRCSLLGPNDQDFLRSKFQLGKIYFKQGDFKLALETSLDTLEKQERALECHPDSIKSYKQVASIYDVLGEEQKATQMREKAHQHQQELEKRQVEYQKEQGAEPLSWYHLVKRELKKHCALVLYFMVFVCLVFSLNCSSIFVWVGDEEQI